jgi:hypothetical protein
MNQDFLPTDNSSTTNLRYDIVVGKLIKSARGHQLRNAPATSTTVAFGLISAILQGLIALAVLVICGIVYIFKQFK